VARLTLIVPHGLHPLLAPGTSLLALTNAATYPTCDITRDDLKNDQIRDARDVGVFVATLLSSLCP